MSRNNLGAESSARIPLQLSRNCIVASIQVDLTYDVLRRFRADLLEYLKQTGAQAVILDLSGLEILDLEEFEALKQTMSMVSLMGAKSIVAGMRPGVVSSLIALNADVDGILAAFNLDDAFSQIEAQN
ncbi:MAG: STAS domain-containing protein [Chloroflexota bacterium]|nr:MAG: STAS domain-containing protein [Chloroflexota bacterium]